jgi:hypothetical protein
MTGRAVLLKPKMHNLTVHEFGQSKKKSKLGSAILTTETAGSAESVIVVSSSDSENDGEPPASEPSTSAAASEPEPTGPLTPHQRLAKRKKN